MQTTKNSASRQLAWFLWLVVFCWAGCMEPGPRALLDGAQLIERRKYPEAVEILKTATVHMPSDARAWNYLGLGYHGTKRYREAIRAYHQALVLDRNLAAARFNLGCAYLDTEQPGAAISELLTFTTLSPNSSLGWLKLGEAQLADHQLSAAEKSFQNALRANPRAIAALNDIGILEIQRKRPAEAWKYFSTAVQQQPNYSPALLNLAVLSQRHFGQLPLALKNYRVYLASNPGATDVVAVDRIIRDLESELNPPPVPASVPLATEAQTSRVTRVLTNQPAGPKPTAPALETNTFTTLHAKAVVSTNALTERPLAPTPTARAATNKLAGTKPPLGIPRIATDSNPPAAKVEAVRLTNEIAFKPALESTGAFLNTTGLRPFSRPDGPVETNWYAAFHEPERVRETNLPAPRTISEEVTRMTSAPPVRIVRVVQEPKEKEPFYRKLNPVHWFKRRPKTVTILSEPLPSREPERALESVRSDPNRPGPKTEAPTVAPVVTNRYSYQDEAALPGGDRVAAEGLLAKGTEAHRQGRLKEAIEAYEQAISKDPGFFEAHYNLGLAAYQLKEWRLSLSAYERALSIKPTSIDARYNFALALQRSGYSVDAAHELEKLLALHPEETRAHFTLANIYAQQLQEPGLAQPHYRKVLELDPNHPQAAAIRYWLVAHP